MEYFAKKDEPRKLFVSEIIDCKVQGYLNAENRTLTDSQHIKVSERLLKSARQFFVKVSDHSQGKSAPEIHF